MHKFNTLYPDAKTLIVDDEPQLLISLSTVLENAGYRKVDTLGESLRTMEMLKGSDYACVVLDLLMPGISGEKLLPRIVKEFPDIPVIVLTADNNLNTVVSCMRAGAYDYLTKPVSTTRFLSTVEKSVRIKMLQDENLILRRGLMGEGPQHPDVFNEIVSNHPKMKSIFTYMEAVAGSPHPVLITGESGTGKELVARSLHRLSQHSCEFIAINIAGLDDNHFSDTLFGHTKGAFTGADKERIGLVSKAEDGVLFLDEIGNLEPSSQLKLLRLLQEREYYPLGSDRAYHTNTKYILATNRNLDKAIQDNQFRKDLYFRLKTHTIHVPPLRERLSDLPLLIGHFITKHANLLGKRAPGYPPQLLDLMNHYHFPGNVRELENMVADAVTRSNNNILPLEAFQQSLNYRRPDRSELVDSMEAENPDASEPVPTLKELEAAHISYVLRLTHNNLTVASKLLGMNYSTLYRRLKRAENSEAKIDN